MQDPNIVEILVLQQAYLNTKVLMLESLKAPHSDCVLV